MSQEQQRAYLEALSSTFDVAERIRGSCSQIPPLEIRGLVSSLDRNSGTPRGVPALAHRLTHRALLTRGPSLSSMPDKERYASTTSVLPRHGLACLEPGHSVVKEPVGPLVSLWRTRVPKPTWISSFCTYKKRKWKKGERRCACAHK